LSQRGVHLVKVALNHIPGKCVLVEIACLGNRGAAELLEPVGSNRAAATKVSSLSMVSAKPANHQNL
jgi:hypothetical protein